MQSKRSSKIAKTKLDGLASADPSSLDMVMRPVFASIYGRRGSEAREGIVSSAPVKGTPALVVVDFPEDEAAANSETAAGVRGAGEMKPELVDARMLPAMREK